LRRVSRGANGGAADAVLIPTQKIISRRCIQIQK